MSSQADETPGEADPRWGMVTLARLQPGSKVQDRVHDGVHDKVQDKAPGIGANYF